MGSPDRADWTPNDEGWRFWFKLAVVALFLGACFAAFIGWVVVALSCDDGCAGGERHPLVNMQLVLALVGLLPAGMMLYNAFKDQFRAPQGP
jgi:hypothetical protein